jgi:hypothetical protein
VQRQFELAHSLLEIVKERLCLVLMLKADDGVIRIADHGHVARVAVGRETASGTQPRRQEAYRAVPGPGLPYRSATDPAHLMR